MLNGFEQIAFVALVALCGLAAARGFARIVRVVRRGRPAHRTDGLLGRIAGALIDVGLQKPLFKARPIVGVFHAVIFFGFSFYLLVNVNDILEGYVPGHSAIGRDGPAGAFNLFADLFSVLVLTGMVFFLLRRFVARPRALRFRENVLLQPGVAAGGIRRDSLIVGTFILLHVGGRWSGSALRLAETGHSDPWLPTASLLARLFEPLSPAALQAGLHLTWWLAMGLIVLFLPYFPFSKHIHLMIAPVNLALARRGPRGRLEAVTDPQAPGAARLLDLPWPQVLDAYACIMCNRCQEVCPAYASGTPLSPSALEINKRYFLNAEGGTLASGGDAPELIGSVIREDAVWSCTTCFACVRVCPVGNEPMHDIIEMRRRRVFAGRIPDELTAVLKNLDEQGNSFGESARNRARWAKELGFEIKDPSEQPVRYLWYVGDFASYNPVCRETTRKVARVLHAAGVDFGIVRKAERSAGNDVRRAGEEGLFEALAEKNRALLAGCKFEEILTTDPHTYNALRNEYPVLGGNWPVHHYAPFLLGLIREGRIRLKKKLQGRVTYHDPCFLGRYNGEFDAPREIIRLCGLELVEMPRNRENSFCCGAGGGKIWLKEHEDLTRRPSEQRIDEAMTLGRVDWFTVACPKDMTMYSDAVKTSGHEGSLAVRDLIDYVYEAMGLAESGSTGQAA